MPHDDERVSRRETLLGAGALAALMLQPGWLSAARAQAPAVKADPRHALVDCVAEITIPQTDTPGASAAGVATFVLLALDERMNGLDPLMLTTLRESLDRSAGGTYLASSPVDQLRILQVLDSSAFAAQARPGSPEHAWRRIKAAIVAGYYTSEAGASQELVFEPVPGRSENITLTPDFRAPSNDAFGGAW